MSFFPFAVGGVGGSGTRIVAQGLLSLGCHLGFDVNDALDNLTFTLLFKHQDILTLPAAAFAARLAILQRSLLGVEVDWSVDARAEIERAVASAGMPAAVARWFRLRQQALLQLQPVAQAPCCWGWKEPNTHVVLGRLFGLWPRLRYVHVRRSGFDMAFSLNQRQTLLWGPLLLGLEVPQAADLLPAYALKYWCAAERRVLEVTAAAGREADVLVLQYEHLCANPAAEWLRLLQFLAAPPLEAGQMAALCHLVKPAASIGRFREHDLRGFDAADVDFALRCGAVL